MHPLPPFYWSLNGNRWMEGTKIAKGRPVSLYVRSYPARRCRSDRTDAFAPSQVPSALPPSRLPLSGVRHQFRTVTVPPPRVSGSRCPPPAARRRVARAGDIGLETRNPQTLPYRFTLCRTLCSSSRAPCHSISLQPCRVQPFRLDAACGAPVLGQDLTHNLLAGYTCVESRSV